MAGKRKLTPNEKIFADEWLIDRNGVRAYKVAYKSCKSDEAAAVGAHKKLRKANINTYIQTRLDVIAKKCEITTERVLKEYAKIAFLDPQQLFDDDGNLLPIQEIPKEVAAAIGGLDVSQRQRQGGEEELWETIKKIKLIDKKGALDSLARYLGLFEKDNKQKGGDALANLLGKIAGQGPPSPMGDDTNKSEQLGE